MRVLQYLFEVLFFFWYIFRTKVEFPVRRLWIRTTHVPRMMVGEVIMTCIIMKRAKWNPERGTKMAEHFFRQTNFREDRFVKQKIKELERTSAELADAYGIPQHVMRQMLGLDRL